MECRDSSKYKSQSAMAELSKSQHKQLERLRKGAQGMPFMRASLTASLDSDDESHLALRPHTSFS